MKKSILLAAALTMSFGSLPSIADGASYGSTGIGAVYSKNLIATGFNRYPWHPDKSSDSPVAIGENAPDSETLGESLRQTNQRERSARLAELISELEVGDSGEAGSRLKGSALSSNFSAIQLLAAP